MQRFSFPELPLWKDITISEDSFIHQISRVLRSSIGENIVLFNGDGQEYVYMIDSISKKGVSLSFEKKYENAGDSGVTVRLYQAIPNKYEKIEYIIQKGTEVWVREFIFFRTERSQRLIINDRKKERFSEIAREATEQCFWNRVPSIVFLEDMPSLPEDGMSYVLHTEAKGSKHLRDVEILDRSINIFIGPEGGWSTEEMHYFKENGIENIHLWNRILRTETAGSVVAFFLHMK